jgi:signal transduction histidine kinase/ActR/RegA family two-component response regulator
MPQRLSSRLSLKGFIILTLLLVGLAPLAASVAVNMPMVVAKLEQLGELERLNELEQQVTALARSMEHRKENLRTINALPGTADLFSDPADLLLDPKNIKQRMGVMFSRWLSPEAGVEAVFMVNAAGAPVGNWGVNGSTVMRQRALENFPEAQVVAAWLAESKSIPLGTVYVAGVEQDFLDNGSKHSHFAHIILGIPGVNSAGAYGGAILMKISLAPFLEQLAYDFVVTGAGQLLQRYEPDHQHDVAGNHAHGEIAFGVEFAELLTVADDRKHLILTAVDGRKVAFVKIIDDLHREHAVWLAHAMHPGELEVWVSNFQGRLALILVFLMGLVFVLAMLFAGRAEKMRQQLVGGLNRLIDHKEPLRLGWSFPVEVKELGQELEVLGQSLIRSDETLRQKERFLKGIFDGIQDGLSVQNREYTILETNATLEEWYPDKLPLVGRKCYEVYHDRPTPCEACPVREVLDQGVLHRCEMAGQATGDARAWLEVFAYPVRNEQGEIIQVVELIRDISAKKKAEDERDNLANQLIFAQKMEAVGTLAGGVAHDFNNILSAINGYAEMCLMKMEEDNPLWPKIKTILDSGQRASRLTQQLLAFSRKQIIHPQDIDVDQSLAGIRKMLARILGEDIDINMVIGPDLWHIHADQTQFEQVLINLAVNARDAMPRGGKLTFDAKNIVLDQAYVERHYEIVPGEYVLLAISDNGEGMDKETMAKIFEPFFTTKAMGKGTGLGLATVYGIIKQSNGEILVYSEPGQGTTFKIYLPRHQEVGPVPATLAEPEDLATGSETVLLVEDDDVVRTMTVEILTSLGYSVLEAADGEEALQTCKRYHGRIGLLFTDVVMPKMNGAELAAKVVKLRPDIKVLFMSGYTDDAVVRHGILQDDVHFIQKPVTPKILAQTLRQVLGPSPTET